MTTCAQREPIPTPGPFEPVIWGRKVLEAVDGHCATAPANHGKRKRAGRFELLASDVLNMEWGVLGIMTRCCIVKAEHNLITDRVEYFALSPMFDELNDGELVPTYLWQVEGTNLRAVRVK